MKRNLVLVRALVCSALCAVSAPAVAAQTTQWATPPQTQQVDPSKMQNPDVVARPGPLERMLVGTWDLWVPGGIWYSSDGRSVYQHYTPGAAMNRLAVRADGSYQWGSQKGRLIEIRPWFAQEGQRYYAVSMNASTRYMARWDAAKDQLLMFFWGVGGHAVAGTRIGKAPTPVPSVPTPPQPTTVAGGTVHYAGTATNSGTVGNARIALTRAPTGNAVEATASFSGGLGGDATLRGTLQGEQLVLTGELAHAGTRYAMVVTGRIVPQGALTASYSITPQNRAGAKQGGTITARVNGTANTDTPTAPVPAAGAATSPPPADNPLGVEWVSGSPAASAPAPASSEDPACTPNALGVVWAQCESKAAAPVTPAPAASPLARSWRYTAVQTRAASGEVRDHSAQTQGTLALRVNGTFSQELRIGTQRVARSGSYQVDGEQLRLRVAGGQTATLWFHLDGDQLWLQEEQSGTAIRYGLVSP